jgi:hypothetical protein
VEERPDVGLVWFDVVGDEGAVRHAERQGRELRRQLGAALAERLEKGDHQPTQTLVGERADAANDGE